MAKTAQQGKGSNSKITVTASVISSSQQFLRRIVPLSSKAAILATAYLLLVTHRTTSIANAFSPTRPSQRPTHNFFLLASMTEDDKNLITPQDILIAGAGVIGISTAYYLQKHHLTKIQSITLIDPTGTTAPAASGKAGGFLALDWNDRTYTQQLTRRSFALHQELADELDASTIQYRRLTCAAVTVNPYHDQQNSHRRPSGRKLDGVEWVEPTNADESAVVGMRPMGDTSSIAQVHPKKLCERMWEEVCRNVPDTKIIKGTVKGAVHNLEDGRLGGARLADDDDSNDSIVPGDALLFACGPWTADFVTGVKYHSIVVPTNSVLTQCVFFSGCGDPEVYVRPDSTAYCTGFPEPERRVTEHPGQERIEPEKIATILESVSDACGHQMNKGSDNKLSMATGDNGSSTWALDITKPVVQQACYLPTTPDNLPVMGRVPKEISGCDGCYIATGHGCWGILLGPASGECMSNLIMTGESSTTYVNLAPFDPARVGAFQLAPPFREASTAGCVQQEQKEPIKMQPCRERLEQRGL